MAKQPEPTPTLVDLNIPGKVRVKIQTRMKRLDEINELQSQLKAEKEVLDAELVELMKPYGAKAQFQDLVYNTWTGSTSWIKKDVLVIRGVAPDIIQEATGRKEYDVVQVTNIVRAAEQKQARDLEKARQLLTQVGEL